MQNRKQLVHELREKLIPVFIANGFQCYPLSGEEKRSKDLRSMFPFGYLKRKNSDGTLDGVEIQLDSKGKSVFIINFGRTSKNEFLTPMGYFLTQDQITSYSMEYSFRLYDSKFFKIWFGNRFFNKSEDPVKIVQRAVIYSEEINNWFNEGIVGPHIK
ncbi:hypothetical protein NDN13_01690 [Acinetobacter sp. C32I]|uniref:hypothetical protein n=1 Tax=Acinetobacter TaxID=469 RepID=UPI001F4B5749|nr:MULTISPECIES: hypothetical protein [Acinetobacter]MCH7290780.1 hypothetical protein [Acinetobacter genomosp. 15BJ]USA53932.1 hypothetical protein NDN13_01690 [Acinetobacter sp. C32I]